MLIFFAVLGGFILDAIFGDPLWLPHPVVYMGKVISFLDKNLRKILPKTPRGERIGGAITAFVLPVGTLGARAIDSNVLVRAVARRKGARAGELQRL